MEYYQLLKLLVLGICFHQTQCDVYLHNPRGSNNRYNENTRNRRNAKRMFNSENNDRGGYNVGKVYYYTGSKLQIEWTNQHSCGDQNSHCDIVLQYMCGNLVRDGTSSSTIPENPVLCQNLDCNEDRRYGMHEDFFYHAHCRLRSRNKGLFTSDQRVGEAARNTRQNRNGNRYGYECTEEKDYYPYWGPSPWRDIAVLTNNASRCAMYQRESQNVKARYACDVGTTYLYQNAISRPSKYIPITQAECETFQYTESGITKNGTWRLYEAHGIDSPACVAALPSRDNHLGNTLGGQTLSYNWTIPDYPQENCALRIRYNISTTEYDGETANSSLNRMRRNNGVDLWSRHGLSEQEGVNRGYVLKGNPEVNIFNSDKLKLQLAVNTAQYGRTFQDRSHTFSIRSRPADIPTSANILNVNVRGKRGNIVQVYPAVEYDYVPNTALLRTDSYVHFQWTGSNNNPQNNDGQGRAGTDRSNVVMMKEASYTEGNPAVYKSNSFGQLGASYPAIISDSVMAGMSREDLISMAILRSQLGGDMDELNDAGTYYDLGARKVTRTGTYNYMCTRNNNFSNRSQKGKLLVTDSSFMEQYVDQNGATLTVFDRQNNPTSTSVRIPPEALTAPAYIVIRELSKEDADDVPTPPNTDYVSEIVLLSPEGQLTSLDNTVRLSLRLTGSVGALYDTVVYRSTTNGEGWEQVEIASQDASMVSVDTHRGGYFVASRSVAAGPMAGLVIGLILLFILMVAVGIYCTKNKVMFASYKGKV